MICSRYSILRSAKKIDIRVLEKMTQKKSTLLESGPTPTKDSKEKSESGLILLNKRSMGQMFDRPQAENL